MTLSQSDKITLTKYPPLPSQCRVCFRSANGELEFVDFQCSVDYEGAINICTDCWISAASLFGYVSPVAQEETVEQLRVVHTQYEELKKEHERTQHALDSLLSVRPSLKPDYPVVNDSPGEDSEILDQPFDFDSPAEGKDDRESDESATERRFENPLIPKLGNFNRSSRRR